MMLTCGPGAEVCKNWGLKICCSVLFLIIFLSSTGVNDEGLSTEPCGTLGGRRLSPYLLCFSQPGTS